MRYWKARGFEVSAVSSPGEALQRFSLCEGVPVFPVEMSRRVTPLSDIVAIARLARILRLVRPHIVHASTPKGGVVGTVAAWLAGVPVLVYAILGLPLMTATGRRRLLLMWSERVACGLADQVFCVSHSLRGAVLAAHICRDEKIRVLANGSVSGVEADRGFDPGRNLERRREARIRFGIPAEATVVGFVGRRARDKGLIELAAAWQALRDANPGAYLLVVGSPEPFDPLPPATDVALGSDDRVRVTGFVDDISLAYAAMDVFVLPSYREGFPVSLLEAAAAGLPVVSTTVAGCVDAVVDGVTGTLVPARDAALLAQAIGAYVNSPALRAAHGTAARARVVREFTPESVLSAVHGAYLQLLNKRAGVRPRSLG